MDVRRSQPWALSAILVLACCTASLEAKAVVVAHPELEATDICLFTCEFCFRDEGLVGCANECLMTEGAMNALWRAACPLFGLQPIFQQVPPPQESQPHQQFQQPHHYQHHQVADARPGLN